MKTSTEVPVGNHGTPSGPNKDMCAETAAVKSEVSKKSRKKKKPVCCFDCGIELSWKELTAGRCFPCDRNRWDKRKIDRSIGGFD